MKRRLLLLLVVVVAASWLGTLIVRDPGYFLVSYGDRVVQTSLWVGLALIAVTILATYYGIRLVRGFLNVGGSLAAWQSQRRMNRAVDLYGKGVKHYLEGDYGRALRFLEGCVDSHPFPANNYLLQALSAGELGDEERAARALAQAAEFRGNEAAAALVRARVAALRGDWSTSLAALDGAHHNAAADKLRQEAALALGDDDTLRKALPDLHRSQSEHAHRVERSLALSDLETSDPEEARARFKRLPTAMRHDVEVVQTYAAIVGEVEAERALREALGKHWHRQLLVDYASLGATTLDKRRTQIRQWFRRHPDDAGLHLADGIVKELAGDRDGASEAYRQSLQLSDSPEANQRLADLLAFAGDYAASNTYLKAALRKD